MRLFASGIHIVDPNVDIFVGQDGDNRGDNPPSLPGMLDGHLLKQKIEEFRAKMAF